MVQEAPSIPTLSEPEQTLLVSVPEPALSLYEISQKHALSGSQLLDLVSSEAFRSALRAVSDFNTLRAAALSSSHRAGALDALADLASSAPEPRERRLAATSFLRGVTPASARSSARPPPPVAPPPPLPLVPTGKTPALPPHATHPCAPRASASPPRNPPARYSPRPP